MPDWMYQDANRRLQECVGFLSLWDFLTPCERRYEACGCRVTFIAASGYKTSRMLPGKDCTEHTHVDQTQSRTDLVERGRDAMITATATQAARDAYEKGD